MKGGDESLSELSDRDLLRSELIIQMKDALDALIALFDMLDDHPEQVPTEQYLATWKRAREAREALR